MRLDLDGLIRDLRRAGQLPPPETRDRLASLLIPGVLLDVSTYKPVPGTLGDANQVANGFQAVQNVVNAIDNLNFAAGKIFDPAKLMQNAAVDKNALAWDNAANQWSPKSLQTLGAITILDRVTATTDVANTVTESTIYTKTITGLTLGTAGKLRLVLDGDYLHNNVIGDTIIVRIKYGATTLYQSNAYNLGNVIANVRHPFTFELWLQNLALTNSQLMTAKMTTEPANFAAPTSGEGQFNATMIDLIALGISSEDSTVDKTLAVTVQWSAANANNSWRVRAGSLEIV